MPSYTKAAAILVVFASYHLTIAAPAPRPVPDGTNEISNAYSGAAGNASGGNIKGNTVGNTAGANLGPASSILNEVGLLSGGSLVEAFSGNGGKGGHAVSGSASAPSLGNLGINGAPTNANADDTTITGNGSNTVGNAYSGTGGQANGGNVEGPVGGVIRVFSGNGGAGGDAGSGEAGKGPVLLSKKLSGVGRTRVSRVIRLYLD